MPEKSNNKTAAKVKLVFIVEDNETYAKSIQSFIHSRFPEIRNVMIFGTGELCLAEMHRDPDIVIMDYFLNSKNKEALNGLEVIKTIKAQKPKTSIIMLSVQKNMNVFIEAIEKHGCIYIQKGQGVFQKVEKAITDIYKRENAPIIELRN